MPLNVQTLVRARRDRCVAQILRYAEHDSGVQWKDGEWEDFRENVLSAINGYHDVMLDMIRSMDRGRP